MHPACHCAELGLRLTEILIFIQAFTFRLRLFDSLLNHQRERAHNGTLLLLSSVIIIMLTALLFTATSTQLLDSFCNEWEEEEE